MGVGDRFAHQAKAQLAACMKAGEAGVEVVPVWNKSNREHTIIGTEPSADAGCGGCGGEGAGLDEAVLSGCRPHQPEDRGAVHGAVRLLHARRGGEIGKPAAQADVDAFVERHPELVGEVTIPAIDEPFKTDEAFVKGVANKFLAAVQDAGRIYRHLVEVKGEGRFVPEVSMDETDSPQTPVELLIILAAIADEKIPIQTIAPKFTGRFNKGVDYVGDVAQFTKEFERGPGGDCVCGEDVWAAGEPEAERALGLGQVFDLQGDPRGGEEVRRGRSPEDGGDDVAGGADRAGGGGRSRGLEIAKEVYARGVRARGRAVRAVCDGDRHRPGEAAACLRR